jgi:hypothetical protein
MRRVVLLLVSGSMVLASCTAADTAEQTSSTAPEAGSAAGRLAILDGSGNIVTMNPDGSDPTSVTEDGESVRYFQPIWARDSDNIAWGEGDAAGFAVGIADGKGEDRASIPVEGFPFYTSWSPGDQRIGFLHNGENGSIDFGMVDLENMSAALIDSGVPYYFSWSPDGKALVVHVDGTRLEIIDEAANPTDLGDVTANFFAPSWTEAGILFVGPNGLVLRRPDGSFLPLLRPAPGFIGINANHDGSKIAVHVLAGDQPGLTVGLTGQEDAAVNGITILDGESAELVSVIDRMPVGSFWSPDGQKLAVLTLSDQQGFVDLAVWSESALTAIDSIELDQSFVAEVLPFFDQYAQSWQIWDPGSSQFVLPAQVDGEAGIWVFAADGTGSLKVSEGSWAAWSSN